MTAFFCDTDCELNYKVAEELGIKNIIRMPYTICGEEKLADLGEDYDPKDFFGKVRAGNIPITSALNPEDYKRYFEPFYQRGEDIFYVSFSSEMSGTFNYMEMALKELNAQYPGVKFTRYDTKSICMGAGILVYAAAKKFLQEGKSVEQVCAELDKIRDIADISIVVDDLQHLKRGGRLTAMKAIIGSILNMKPIIKLTKKGTLIPVSTVPGRNKALTTVINEVVSTATLLDEYPIVVLNADCREEADRVTAKIQAALPNATIWQYDVGPVIGAHCGPGTIGICYFGAERPDAPSND